MLVSRYIREREGHVTLHIWINHRNGFTFSNKVNRVTKLYWTRLIVPVGFLSANIFMVVLLAELEPVSPLFQVFYFQHLFNSDFGKCFAQLIQIASSSRSQKNLRENLVISVLPEISLSLSKLTGEKKVKSSVFIIWVFIIYSQMRSLCTSLLFQMERKELMDFCLF